MESLDRSKERDMTEIRRLAGINAGSSQCKVLGDNMPNDRIEKKWNIICFIILRCNALNQIRWYDMISDDIVC